MRLSTDPGRDDDRGVAVLHAALDAGITLLDTANAYCWNDSETGHNERLIARALASWTGDRSRVRVATKGGLTRPDGRWVPDGRARSLMAACEASLRALDLPRIPLYQLHAPDPGVPLATSVRALDRLKRDGLIDATGLCNVSVGQIAEARGITDIRSVQVELNIWNDAAVLGGIVEYCETHGLELLAYRPLGGADRLGRVASDPLLASIAAARGVTPFQVALRALADLSPAIVPIPGPTRIETAKSCAETRAIALSDDDHAQIADRFKTASSVRGGRLAARSLAGREGPPYAHERKGEIVIVMGLPGAGKSTLAQELVGRGYTRLNRDEAGGSLDSLLPAIDRAVLEGATRVVLDNTYVTRKSRAPVIRAGQRLGLPVRCVWLTTSIEDAQVNAGTRIVAKYGTLLDPDAMKRARRTDIAAFGPMVQFRYQRELEPPDDAEGFSSIERVAFERHRDPSFTNRGVIVWCDALELPAAYGAVLRAYAAEGWLVLGMSWLPQVAEGTMTPAAADVICQRTRERLELDIEFAYCPHGGGPPVCWCRKPLPGLGVMFVQRHRLDPAQCIYVGSGPHDPGFARRLGFQYRATEEFFSAGPL